MAQQKILSSQLADSGVTAGAYTSANITIDAAGRVTSATDGTSGGTPGGTVGQVQYNNSGVFGGLSDGTDGQVLTSAGVGVPPIWKLPYPEVITDSTVLHSVLGSELGKYIRMTSGSANAVFFDTQLSVPVIPNFEVTFRCAGAGDTTLTAAVGVTLNAPAGGTLVLSTGMTITAKFVGSDEWDIIGQTVAV